MVLIVLLVGLAFAVAGLAAVLDSRGSSTRDTRVRHAQQAADSGVAAETYQQSQVDLGKQSYNFNGGALGLSTLTDCAVPQLNASLQVTGIANVTANSAGICPLAVDPGKNAVSYNPSLGNHTAYQAEMLTNHTNLLNGTFIGSQNGSPMIEEFPKIVSIGSETSNTPAGTGTVYSREEAILAPIAPLQALEGENNVTINAPPALCLPIVGCASFASTLNGDVLARNNLTTPPILAGLNLSNGLLATLAYGGSKFGGLALANVQPVNKWQIIQRPTVTVAAACSGGTTTGCKNDCPASDSTCSGLGSAYSATTDTFSMTTGTVTFQPGDYVFCNFSATGGTLKFSPSSAQPVRIFVDSPNSARCKNDGLGANQGNFNDTIGYTNGLLGVGGVDAPSGVQIYVVGDGSNDDNTTVQIGPTTTTGLLTLGNVTDAGIVYAPTSKVTVNVPASCLSLVVSSCTGGVFDGAAVGNDTTITALTITQDLDIGNFPLYAGINAYRVVQYVQCSTSVTSLTRSTADLSGC